MKKIMTSRFWWLFLLIGLVAVNFLASVFHARLDLTKEKRYTLSKATRDLLRSLETPVQIDIFLTGDLNAGFRKLANSTEEFVALLKDRNSSKVQYRVLSPMDAIPGSSHLYRDTLEALGAVPINLTDQTETGASSNIIYPVALVSYDNKQELVRLYTGSERFVSQSDIVNSEAGMEYEFARVIDQLVSPRKPFVAYSIGNGEPMDARTYGIQEALDKDYRLALLNINNQPVNADTFDVLLMVKPSLQFTEAEKLKIDQYVMNGGKLLLFIDALIAEQDSLKINAATIAYDRNLNLTDQLFKYGARINPSIVMDLQCDFMPFVVGGTPDNPQREFLHWNYYPLFEPKGNHSITRGLGLVAGRFVNSIDTIATEGVRKTVLLASSANSRILSTPVRIDVNENRNAPEDANFQKKDIPVALLLEGSFTSNYRHRVTNTQRDSLTAAGITFRDRSDENKMIIVGDGDMALNDVSPTNGPLPLGVNIYTLRTPYQYQFANRAFLLNCLEYLVSKPAISETRNKNIVMRLLDSKKVKENKKSWQMINIALPILIVVLAGIVYQYIRKRKYAE
jgi:ABC-2 type transport system permease protein